MIFRAKYTMLTNILTQYLL